MPNGGGWRIRGGPPLPGGGKPMRCPMGGGRRGIPSLPGITAAGTVPAPGAEPLVGGGMLGGGKFVGGSDDGGMLGGG